uniref:hypothetical protein n=1 Tax=Klebsiella pneumoniae TaxID=573 RepID=UPI002074AB3A
DKISRELKRLAWGTQGSYEGGYSRKKNKRSRKKTTPKPLQPPKPMKTRMEWVVKAQKNQADSNIAPKPNIELASGNTSTTT